MDEKGEPAADGFDLGPSWFWPDRQPSIAALVRALGLESFAQNATGDVAFERMSREPPHRLAGLRDDPQSQRIVGGSAALVDALVREIPRDRLNLDAQVVAMKLTETGVKLTVKRDPDEGILVAQQVIAATPPRLLAATVQLDPAPDPEILQLWKSTPTWMAPHAKFFALYNRPFWREAGFSGTAQSLVGPLAEIHDATTRSGQAALFGFIGAGAGQRAALGEEALKAACLQQLERIFGPEARTPVATLLKDWAADPFTATPEDAAPTGHGSSFGRGWISGPWARRLLLAGSETSHVEAGFLAGAVEAAERAVSVVLEGSEEVALKHLQ